ncbi:MAG: glycosyltransferase family 39 protein [Acidobacteriota bacterium]|nr:glycosyltransferase family 39 protein [Acidobacteriota bacterium]
MSAPYAGIVTAGLRPELFADSVFSRLTGQWLIVMLTVLALAGFCFRAAGLSAEGLSEDELNKLNAVADYRAHGLTAINSEHPLLMKALQTGTIVAAEQWNAMEAVAARSEGLSVPVETALRLPSALFGALTLILIYLVAVELFGAEVALLAAALWAFDPAAISFNRIAKEDTFLLFFFLLANVFWLRGQRVAESQPEKNPERYYWATGAAFGAMMASKYLPHFIAISVSYYWIFQGIPAVRWRLGRPRFALLLAIAGVVFLLCNPTILLPETWRQMLAFAGQKRVGHDGYEFLGTLYPHRMTGWLKGVPWYFYYVFMGVKLPLATLAAFLVGLPLLFRRRLGDGRYFLLFWMLFWLPFTLLGGKFTRYFTTALPIVLITAALGAQFIAQYLAARLASRQSRAFVRAGIVLSIAIFPVWSAVSASPHYRLYTNWLGGGSSRAGTYFPHDEFYDAGMRQAMADIADHARSGARVASETPGLAEFYARQAGRADLIFVSLSEQTALRDLSAGDFLLVARGRRYFSNDELVTRLSGAAAPTLRAFVGSVPAVDVYELDEKLLAVAIPTAR